MNNRISNPFFITLVLCSTSLFSFGQSNNSQDKLITAQNPANLPHRVFIMCNTTKIQYSVSFDQINWLPSTINNIGKPDTWKMDNDFYIKVITESKDPVIYKLIFNNYYLIKWDDQNQRWDVYKVISKKPY